MFTWESLLDAHTMSILPFLITYRPIILYLNSKYKQIKRKTLYFLASLACRDDPEKWVEVIGGGSRVSRDITGVYHQLRDKPIAFLSLLHSPPCLEYKHDGRSSSSDLGV